MRARVSLLLAVSALLAACSVATPPRLASAQPTGKSPPSVALFFEPEDRSISPLVSQFAAAVTQELGKHGIAVAADAGPQVTLTIVQRPAAIGVSTARRPEAADWIALPRKQHWTDRCTAQRIEATLIMRADPTDSKIATARGGFDDCTAARSKVDELAGLLVAALLGR